MSSINRDAQLAPDYDLIQSLTCICQQLGRKLPWTFGPKLTLSLSSLVRCSVQPKFRDIAAANIATAQKHFFCAGSITVLVVKRGLSSSTRADANQQLQGNKLCTKKFEWHGLQRDCGQRQSAPRILIYVASYSEDRPNHS